MHYSIFYSFCTNKTLTILLYIVRNFQNVHSNIISNDDKLIVLWFLLFFILLFILYFRMNCNFSFYIMPSNIITIVEIMIFIIFLFCRGSRMCELWCYLNTTLEKRWKWTLPLQCLRSLLQNEWTK